MYEYIKEKFKETFGRDAEFIASAPGRTEIVGNHTDHQRGCVLAAAVDRETAAAVRPTGGDTVRILSEGYPMCEIDLRDLSIRTGEIGTTAALIRGVAAGFAERGYPVAGFDAYAASQVLSGSGLSSSAAFEVLVGVIFDRLAGGICPPEEIAKIGQYAENVYFGKPCGLMDQMASAVGGMIGIDFADPAAPIVSAVDFDFARCGYSLCVIDSGADHAGLTAEYAAIPAEMGAVCASFGIEYLRELPEEEFYGGIARARATAGDRAVLRAMHFYDENRRAVDAADALRIGDFARFLRIVGESGRSSWTLLQNITQTGETRHQDMAYGLAIASRLLAGRGACRVHGGGFAGTLLAFVPDDMLAYFRAGIEGALGEGRCTVMHIRDKGGCTFDA